VSGTEQSERNQADRLCRLFCKVIGEVIAAEAIRNAGDDAITTSQFEGLQFIYSHPSCCIKDLAEGLSVSHPAAVKMVERLVARGLVRRRKSVSDARVVQLRPTQTGNDVMKSAQSNRAQFTEAVLNSMDDGGGGRLLKEMAGFVRSAVRLNEGCGPSVCLHCGLAHTDDCPLYEVGAAGADSTLAERRGTV